jgi:enoyl-CoA hydratase/carnithine racemase
VGVGRKPPQALSFQFVQRVVPAAELEEETMRWARHCRRPPSPQFAHAKDKIRRSIELMGVSSLHAVLGDHIQTARLWTNDPPAEGDKFGRDSGADQDVARV